MAQMFVRVLGVNSLELPLFQINMENVSFLRKYVNKLHCRKHTNNFDDIKM